MVEVCGNECRFDGRYVVVVEWLVLSLAIVWLESYSVGV